MEDSIKSIAQKKKINTTNNTYEREKIAKCKRPLAFAGEIVHIQIDEMLYSKFHFRKRKYSLNKADMSSGIFKQLISLKVSISKESA